MLELIPLALTLLTVAGYGAALARLRQRGVRWPTRRTACLAVGSLCVAAAVLPPISAYDEIFPVHVTQHLLVLGHVVPFLARHLGGLAADADGISVKNPTRGGWPRWPASAAGSASGPWKLCSWVMTAPRSAPDGGRR